MTEDKMVEWHHQMDGHDFDQGLGVGERQGDLSCCSSWVWKASDTPELLNHNNNPITNGMFHRTRTKNFRIHTETQKTPNSQSSLEQEE